MNFSQAVAAVYVKHIKHIEIKLSFLFYFSNNLSTNIKMSSSFTNIAFKKHSQRTIKSFVQLQKARRSSKIYSNLRLSLFSTSTCVRNDPNIVKSTLPDISVPTTSLYDIIWDAGVIKFGTKTATVRTIKYEFVDFKILS